MLAGAFESGSPIIRESGRPTPVTNEQPTEVLSFAISPRDKGADADAILSPRAPYVLPLHIALYVLLLCIHFE